MVDASRRALFRGRPQPRTQIRPPWARAEADFIDRCTRCNECLNACPSNILIAGDGGYPTVNFSLGECTFCGECLNRCQPGALLRIGDEQPAWYYKARIGESCLPASGIECRVCGDFCATQAIRFSPRRGGSPLPTIEHSQCTGCGACLAPCPTQAITIA